MDLIRFTAWSGERGELRGFDAAEEWLDDWTAGVSAQAERAAQLARNVSALSATAHGVDDLVAVTVGSSGQLTDLRIDDRVSLRGGELAREILALTRTAQARLSDRVAAQVRETVGVDTETGRAVIDAYQRRFPEPAPAPGARGGSAGPA